RKEKYHERKDTRAVNDPYILFHPFDRNESQHKDHEEARHIENYLTDAEICTILAACHRRTDHYDTHYRKNRDEKNEQPVDPNEYICILSFISLFVIQEFHPTHIEIIF